MKEKARIRDWLLRDTAHSVLRDVNVDTSGSNGTREVYRCTSGIRKIRSRTWLLCEINISVVKIVDFSY